MNTGYLGHLYILTPFQLLLPLVYHKLDLGPANFEEVTAYFTSTVSVESRSGNPRALYYLTGHQVSFALKVNAEKNSIYSNENFVT